MIHLPAVKNVMIRFDVAVSRYFLTIAILLGVTTQLFAQTYWQQKVDYNIRVSLDDKKHILNAHADIVYRNQSPTELKFIWFHLWPNAYRDRNTALAQQLKENGRTALYFSKPQQRGYIDSLDFKVNGMPVRIEKDSLNPDIIKLLLTAPLKPGESVTISTPFRVKLPEGQFSRLGHTGQQYLITQWYPKPAVYDAKGWHQMPYLNTGEFYSEFGSFDVTITLPENYVVAASGVLQEETERNWLLDKSRSGITVSPDSMRYPATSKQLKTISYKMDSIHDFAFFADKRYLVSHDTLLLPSGRIIDCFSFVTPKNAGLWKNSTLFIKKAVLFYSEKVGEYPYPSVSVADGLDNSGTDMEYPMLTILSSPIDEYMLEDLIVHEVGHNWFYSILGTNERNYPFIDEGLNTAIELWYMRNKNGNDLWGVPGMASLIFDSDDIDLTRASILRYRLAAASGEDQHASLSSEVYSSANYGAVVYYKTGIIFNYLRTYLGDSLFTACMHRFYKDWSFKHPYPEDLENSFEQTSGMQLDWFFRDLLQTTLKTDAVPRIANDGNSFTISEKGGLSIPVPYTLYASETVVGTGFAFPGTTVKPEVTFDKVIVGSEFYPEVNTRNNISTPSGFLRNTAPVRLSMWPVFKEKDHQHTINFLPVPAWNTSNNWMAGFNINNYSIIPKPFEYSLTPLFDFSHGDIAGTGKLQYTVVPETGVFQSITAGVSGKRFGQLKNVTFPNYPEITYDLLSYNKVEPFIAFNFRKQDHRSTLNHSVTYRNSQIWQEEINYLFDGVNYYPEKATAHLQFHELEYSLINNRTVDPFRSSVAFEQTEDQIKASLEFSYTLSYAKYGKGIRTRIFAGYFLQNDQTERNYNFRMSGWSGDDDYKYDYYYFGRNDASGLWNKQFILRDGGFVTPTAVGQTNEWLAAVNIHADLPIPVPVKFFMNIGTYKGIEDVFPEIANTYMYDGGLALSFGEAFEVYFPLFYSDDIDTSLETNDVSFKETIRFVLNINKLSLQQVRDTLNKWF